MNTNVRDTEYQAFINAQREFASAVGAGDSETAQLAFGEIEAAWLNTDWPRLRAACAAFLQRHAEYAGSAVAVN